MANQKKKKYKVKSLRSLSCKSLIKTNPRLLFDYLINSEEWIYMKKGEKKLYGVYINLIEYIKKNIVDCGSKIFGGFVRDFVIGKRSFSDIDAYFRYVKEDEYEYDNYYEYYGFQNRNVCRLGQLIQKIRQNLSYLYYVELVGYHELSLYSTVKLKVSHKQNDKIYIYVDLSVKDDINSIVGDDFDVNQFVLDRDEEKNEFVALKGKRVNLKFTHLNDGYINSVLKRVKRKEYIVLDLKGDPSLKHIYKRNCDGLCKLRNTFSYDVFGDYLGIFSKKDVLIKRICKMNERGWTILNKVCSNPLCVLSNDFEYKKAVEKEKILILTSKKMRKLQKQEILEGERNKFDRKIINGDFFSPKEYSRSKYTQKQKNKLKHTRKF